VSLLKQGHSYPLVAGEKLNGCQTSWAEANQ